MGYGGQGDTPHPVIESWRQWMTAAGMSANTIRLRIGHIGSLMRLTQSRSPQEWTTGYLVAVLGSQNWSVEYRRGMRTSLNQMFQFLVKTGKMPENPAEGLPRVPEAKAAPKPTPDQMVRSALAAAGPRELLMVRLAVEAGLRRAEIAAVHRDDVIREGREWSLRVNGKGGRQRIVPITRDLAVELTKPGTWATTDTGFVFPSLDRWGVVIAPHLSPDRVGRLVSDLLDVGWSAHSLRHRYATLAYAGTRNLRAVQECLGHVSVATTQRYTAVTAPELRAVAVAVTTPP